MHCISSASRPKNLDIPLAYHVLSTITTSTIQLLSSRDATISALHYNVFFISNASLCNVVCFPPLLEVHSTVGQWRNHDLTIALHLQRHNASLLTCFPSAFSICCPILPYYILLPYLYTPYGVIPCHSIPYHSTQYHAF